MTDSTNNNYIMKKIMTIAVVILGIACATLITRNVMLHKELDEINAKTERLIIATEDVFNEVEDFVWVNYNVSLSKTLWQGDIYDEWYGAYESIVCL